MVGGKLGIYYNWVLIDALVLSYMQSPRTLFYMNLPDLYFSRHLSETALAKPEFYFGNMLHIQTSEMESLVTVIAKQHFVFSLIASTDIASNLVESSKVLAVHLRELDVFLLDIKLAALTLLL